MELAEEYIKNVGNGKVVCGLTVKQAIQRHLNDIIKSEEKSFDYYFDKKRASLACKAIRMMPHTSGSVAGKPFQLEGWQAFIVWSLYGWRKKVTKTSRYRKVYIKIARKNGKTEFLAAIANLDMMFFPVEGAEMFWAATKKEQAKIGWKRQKKMIDTLISRSKSIKKRFSTNVNRIVGKQTSMTAGSIGRDSKTEDGHLVYRGFIDEYHAHSDSGMVSILETGMGAFDSPLLVIITTAGYNMASACKQLEDNYKDILSGQKENENVFTMIFDLDEGDDWEDDRNWGKANPSLGGALKLDYMRVQYANVLTEGAATALAFKVKNLNVWTNSEITWLSRERWNDSDDKVRVNIDDLIGRKCYGGLDLANTTDINSFTLYFPLDNEEGAVLTWFWIPEETVLERTRRDGVKYLQWVDDGIINTMQGNATDEKQIVHDIMEIGKLYDIAAINIDPWNSQATVNAANDAGYDKIYTFPQNMSNFSHPTKEVERMVLNKRLKHFKNPVLEWMVLNVMLIFDSNDNYKPDKKKSKEKIDGVVSLIMAKAAHISIKEQENVYEKRGMRIL